MNPSHSDNTGDFDEFGAYQALAFDTDSEADDRWAFGTGFIDPLSGVDTAVPPGVPGPALARYCLALGDDALIYSHRLQEWLTRLPELEEETAVANIALDLLGQARLLLSRAAAADPSLAAAGPAAAADEDRLAFFREAGQFRNVRLAERADADFAELMARLLVFSAWRLELMSRLRDCPDPLLSAITARSVSELTYHRDYAAAWVVRLGDGTGYSRTRMAAGLDAVWPYVPELFTVPDVERGLPGIAVDPDAVRGAFDSALDAVLDAATLQRPEVPALAPVSGRTGRDGMHTEALSYLLAEMQSVARAHPEATW
jgi:ring-1,2-phenylacetyl-CoA epoxidase subunit PaaC